MEVKDGPAVALPGAALDTIQDERADAGDFIEILGLTGSIALNGKFGQLGSYCQDTGKFSVRIEGAPGLNYIKRENARQLARELEFEDLPCFLRLGGCRSHS